ncbi:MAG: cation:proton antiporter [bacterium]|nr:cation:proton antiporter [bacterium]
MEGHLFQFALLFGVLGLAATASIWLRFPVVPLYIASGLALGTVIETNEVVEFLGSLGIVFLLFSMGLEFSVGSVAQTPRRFALAGGIDLIFNFPIGLLAGLALGWGWIESLFLAGILYMSSSAVVAKCIADFSRATRPETETILGIMVFEDLAIAGYLLLLNALAIGGSQSMDMIDYAVSLLSALVFVGVLVIVLTRKLQEPLARMLATRTDESFTLLLFAFVLLVASAAIAVNLSEAIGAFLAGVVLGSTELKERAASTLHPFQTLFAALFFVSFGMGIETASMVAVAAPAIVLILLGIATKSVGGYLAGRAAGHTPAQSAVVGLSLVPKGEFSILIAGLAAGVAHEGSDIVALTVMYVFALSIIGPVAMREADRIWKAIT